MSDNFFKVKNGLNLATLTADPTVTPPANSVVGDMAFYNGKLYIYDGSAWGIKPGSGPTGLIVNADVDASAAIDGSKILPDFGSQTIETTGAINGGSVTSTGTLRTDSKLEVYANSAVEAVHIKQLGSGNAILVEDETSPDTTATVVKNDGKIGISVNPSAVLSETLTVGGSAKVQGNLDVTTGDIKVDAGKGLESGTSGALNIGTTSNTTAVNIGTSTATQEVNIGTGAGVTTIKIGGAADTVEISGTLTWVNTTNLEVTDKNIVLNKGGTAGSANGAGISIEENALTVASFEYTGPQVFSAKTTGALRLPVGNDTTERPTGSSTDLKGMVRYNDSKDLYEGYNESTGWSSLANSAVTAKITQASPALTINTVVYFDGTAYKPARADSINTAEIVGIVTKYFGSDLYEITITGEVSGFGSSLIAGDVYFLSDSVAGGITNVEPSVVGYVSLPVGVAISNDIIYFDPKRGVVVGGVNAYTTVTLTNNATTSVQNVSAYDAGKLSGWISLPNSTTANSKKFYIEAPFSKNGPGTNWTLSYTTTGDTPPVGFSMNITSLGVITVTLPSIAGLVGGTITYALNAPAVGASLPLSIDSTALNIVDTAPLSYRNKIINGDMRIDQRATAVSATGYSVDRWRFFKSNTAVESAAQNSDAPAGFSSSLRLTVTTADTSIGALEYSAFDQTIEGFNISDLGFGTPSAKSVTISFWVRSTVVGEYTANIRNPNATRKCPFNYTINAANTWEYKTVTLPGCTDGSWDNTINGGLMLAFYAALGSTYLGGTANTWNSVGAASAYGSGSPVNAINANGNIFAITGVQLEVGSKATAFERRPYGMELLLSQRYAWVVPPGAALFYGTVKNSTNIETNIRLPVSMRIGPTISSLGTSTIIPFYFIDSSTGAGTTNITTLFPTPDKVILNSTGHPAKTNGSNVSFDVSGAGLLFSAEL